MLENAVHHRVAHATVGHDAMTAQHAFLFGAQAQYGAAGIAVEVVGEQFHTIHVEILECVGQHQQFGFGIQRGFLPGRAEKGEADLNPFVRWTRAHKPRRAGDSTAGNINGCESKTVAGEKGGFRIRQEGIELIGVRNQSDKKLPEFAVAYGVGEAGFMVCGNGFQVCVSARQGALFEWHDSVLWPQA